MRRAAEQPVVLVDEIVNWLADQHEEWPAHHPTVDQYFHSLRQSVRRALRTLEQRGLLVSEHYSEDSRVRLWCRPEVAAEISAAVDAKRAGGRIFMNEVRKAIIKAGGQPTIGSMLDVLIGYYDSPTDKDYREVLDKLLIDKADDYERAVYVSGKDVNVVAAAWVFGVEEQMGKEPTLESIAEFLSYDVPRVKAAMADDRYPGCVKWLQEQHEKRRAKK